VFGALGQGVDLYDCKSKYKKIEFFNYSDKLSTENDTDSYSSTISNEHDKVNYNGNKSSVKAVAAGWGHSSVITSDGGLYIFGRPYDFSSLLRIDQIYRFSPAVARFISSSSNSFIFGNTGGFYPTPLDIQAIRNAKSVSCSAGLTCVLTNNGEVYCFGLNRWGQCGYEPESNDHVFNPRKVEDIPLCESIDTGLQHCIVLTTDGLIYTWGKASKGQLGFLSDKTALPPSATPTQVILPPISSGSGDSSSNTSSDSSSNTSSDSSSVSKQRKTNKAKGSKNNSVDIDVKIGIVDSIKAVKVNAGFAHSAALTVDGSVYVWGRGMSLQCKEKSYLSGILKVCDDQLTPRLVELPDGRKAIDICSSYFNVVILAEDRSLWTIGK